MSIEIPPCLVLAGGLGTRLGSVLKDQPKFLAPVGEVKFADVFLNKLAKEGVSKVVLCTGHMAQQIEDYVKDGHRWGLQVSYSREDKRLGTGGALRLAAEQVDSEWLLAANGDSYFDFQLKPLLEVFRRHQPSAALTLCQVEDKSRFGAVEVKADQIVAFREKGPGGPGWINAGVYCLKSEALKRLPLETEVSLEKECFPDWLNHGLFASCQTGNFIDIGTPESLSRAAEVLLS